MTLREEFKEKLKTSVKNRDEIATSTMRLILAALKDRDIAARGQGKDDGVGEAEILSMLQSMIKQRKEAAATYCDAGREELAEREEDEIKIIEEFLPKQLSSEEVSEKIDGLIQELGATDIKDMGKVMAELKGRYAGQIDMGKASAAVKDKLS